MESEKFFREKGIYKVMIVGSIVNFFLFVFKFFVGIVGYSVVMLVDVVYLLFDFIIDIVVIVFVCIVGKLEDKGYDYGYGKYEILVMVIIGLLFLCVGFGIFWNGVLFIYIFLWGGQLEFFGVVVLVVVLVLIVLKEIFYQYIVIQGKKLNFQVVIVNVWYYWSDVLLFIGMVIGIGGVILLGDYWWVFDLVVVVVVSFFIMKVFVWLLILCVDELFEKLLLEDVEKEIEQIVFFFLGVSQFYYLCICRIGNYYVIELYVCMDGKIILEEVYSMVIVIENKLKEMFGKGIYVGIYVELMK